MANPWLTHVKATMVSMKSKGTYKKGDGLCAVIKEAKKTYGKSASAPAPSPKKTVRKKSSPKKSAPKKTRRHRVCKYVKY